MYDVDIYLSKSFLADLQNRYKNLKIKQFIIPIPN